MAVQVRRRRFSIEECYRMAQAGILSTSDSVDRVAKRRFTVHDYYRMAEVGILTEDDRVELIEGEIVEMSPIGNAHNACVDRLNMLFVRGAGDRAIVRTQGSVRLSDLTEPQPDIALLRPRADFYASDSAGPADILLLIEVADTSVQYDREKKLPLYARSGIPEAWLVDLEASAIQVCRDPSPEGYRSIQTLRKGQGVAPAALPDLGLTVDQALG